MDEIEREALARHERHMNHPTHRPLSEGYELVGLRCEEEFARVFGKKVDTVPRPGGDKGMDFRVTTEHGTFKVDVKGARKPANLAVEAGKVDPATIYVLARYTPEKCTLLGWNWGKMLLKQAPRTLPGHSVLNHCIPRSKLRSMSVLLRVCSITD